MTECGCEELERCGRTFSEALAELGRAFYENEQLITEERRAEGRESLAEAVALLRDDVSACRKWRSCGGAAVSVDPGATREAAHALRHAGECSGEDRKGVRLLKEMLERLPEKETLEARIAELEKVIGEEHAAAAARQKAENERAGAFAAFMKEVNRLELTLAEDDLDDDDNEDDDDDSTMI